VTWYDSFETTDRNLRRIRWMGRRAVAWCDALESTHRKSPESNVVRNDQRPPLGAGACLFTNKGSRASSIQPVSRRTDLGGE